MLIIVAVDDISGEMVAYVINKLLEEGANNVHVSRTLTKKGRPGLLFFIDVIEEYFDVISEIIMTELGSTGFNVIETKHYHSQNKVTEHKVIIKSKQKSIEETIRITSSFSSQGKLVKIDPTPEDLKRIIQKTNQKLGIDVTFRELKKKIHDEITTQRDEIVIELTQLEDS